MSRRCQITGRGPQVGHMVSHAHNVSLRRWNINLQKIRVMIDGRAVRIRVSTRAIKSGLITKPPVVLKQRRPKEVRPQVVRHSSLIQEEVTSVGFFSDSSVVSRLFKPKSKTEPTGPVPGVDIPAFDAPEPTYGEELTPRVGGNTRGAQNNKRDNKHDNKRGRR